MYNRYELKVKYMIKMMEHEGVERKYGVEGWNFEFKTLVGRIVTKTNIFSIALVATQSQPSKRQFITELLPNKTLP